MTRMPATRRLRLGTRGSGLALAQTEAVAAMLLAIEPDLLLDRTVVRTRGDADTRSPLQDIGGMGVFTVELERALVRGDIDLAVHSLKDLPLATSPGLVNGALCLRDDARDVLVSRNGNTLASLAGGSVVGTSSTRRTAQLLAARPDLVIRPIRGNVDTRIAKVMAGEFDAVVLAAAGVIRLGLEDRIAEYLALDTFVPAPGQAALAVQCRADDDAVRSLLDGVDDDTVRSRTTAERAFLGGLGGGCSLPVAAIAQIDVDTLELKGWVGAPDGTRSVRVRGTCANELASASELGARLAREALVLGAGRWLS